MPDEIEGLILVLGSPNSDKGELFSIAKERCNLALTELAKRPGWKLLLTGGFGPPQVVRIGSKAPKPPRPPKPPGK